MDLPKIKRDIDTALGLAISEYLTELAVINGAIPELAPSPDIRTFSIAYTAWESAQPNVGTISVDLRT